MAYSKNILPRDAAYYTLRDANILDGKLTLLAGGSAKITIDKTLLSSITSTLLINIYADILLNPLHTDVIMYLDITLEDGYIEQVAVYPNQLSDNALSFPIKLKDGAYSSCELTIYAKIPCNLLLYEICPEQESDITTIIDGVEQSLPHVLYDYNEWPLTIKQEETEVAMIACYLKDNTDVNGHFLMTFYSTEQCDIYVRFKDNEIEELYAPLKYTVAPGHNSIGIPHAYLKRLAGVHTFIVTCQCTNGILTSDTRDILFTIDAGYLAERLINVGMDICDLSIKQTLNMDNPEEIWAIGLDAGELLVKARPYNTDTTATWLPKYSFGKALGGAIEFDGNWVLRKNKNSYTIETDEEPYIFVVDIEHNLIVYYGNHKETQLCLDTNVSAVSVVRGYKSMWYPNQDQGIVCTYLKENKVYVRRYIYNEVTQLYYWSLPTMLLEDEDISNVYVQRLNDYRLSFSIVGSNSNKILITDRTYVNQAIELQMINADISIHAPCVTMVQKEDVNTFIGKIVPFQDATVATNVFTIKFNYPLVHREDHLDLQYYHVLVNNNEVELEKIVIDGYYLSFITKDMQDHQRYDDSIVVVSFDDYYLQLLYHTQYHRIMQNSYTFTLVRPYNTIKYNLEEPAYLNIKPKINLIVNPINIIKYNQVEECVGDIKIKASLNILKVGVTKQSILEETNINIVTNITEQVTLIGIQPI